MKKIIALITIFAVFMTFNLEVLALTGPLSDTPSISVENQVKDSDDIVSVDITWTNISEKYYFSCFNIENSEAVVTDALVDGNKYTVSGLQNGEKYNFEVVPVISGEKDLDKKIEYLYECNINEKTNISPLTEGEPEPEPEPVPMKVKSVKVYPGYKSITLKWKKVLGENGETVKYYIYKSTKKGKKGSAIKKNYGKTKFRDAKVKKNVQYYYRVYAYFPDYETKSETATVVSAKSVRPMYVKITFISGVTLHTHDSKPRKYTRFHGGQTVITEGFGGGKYKFYYKNRLYYASYTRAKNEKCDYWPGKNYTTTTAVNFVNESKVSSKTKYLIWVSTNTQHIYFFKGKKGHWKLMKKGGKPAHWEVSTGKAASPTPIGLNKEIQDKLRRHSGIDYWNCFQTMNSIHGKRRHYKIGKPASHGCVRNYNDKAKWIYNTFPRKTRVITY